MCGCAIMNSLETNENLNSNIITEVIKDQIENLGPMIIKNKAKCLLEGLSVRFDVIEDQRTEHKQH